METIAQDPANLSHNYYDFTEIAKLRKAAQEFDPAALKTVARQFESIFINMMLRHLRSTNEIFSEDNFLNSHAVKMYESMYDHQISVQLADEQGVGLAKIIEQQLLLTNPQFKQTTPNTTTQTTPAESVESKPSVNNPNHPSKIIFDDPVEFAKELLPLAKDAAEKIGVNPRVLLAQAALETGWGRSIIRNAEGESSFNLFNIKTGSSWQKDVVRVSTLEYIDGIAQKQSAAFRKYDSYFESFDDFVNLLQQNSRYAEALENTHDEQKFVNALQDAGYATDPNYAKKIMRIFNSDIFNDLFNVNGIK
ncbi:MAG: flagellar assembly peptidoglycan hydrolase FlgJ [Gammaproteobacteria bacterium]